jgi:arylsulfatase A-like enzyme
MEQPNIIFIMTDQMRGDCLGADGNRYIDTPNLDFIASRGTRFSRGYSAVPSCIPARASLWSGQDQWHAGVLGMGPGQPQIPNDYPHTLAGELLAAGYHTHLVGKGHFHPFRAHMGFKTRDAEEAGIMSRRGALDDYRRWFRRHAPSGVTPDDHGIDWNSWHARPWHTAEYLHPTSWSVTKALHFLENRDREKPFFLNLSFHRPHSPYVPPEFFFNRYYNGETPEPYIGRWSSMHDDPAAALNPNAWRGDVGKKAVHTGRAGYYGEVSFIDNQIGRLINWLHDYDKETYKNTWFIFTSDHGDMLGDHHLWRKTYPYEGSTRIPFIVSPPLGSDIKTGRPAADEVVELRDIMPTVMEIAGLPIPKTVTGRSVLPLLSGADENWRRYIHGEHCTCYSSEQEMQYVTDGKRKYVWLPRTGIEQFFDLEQDPGELHNLFSDPSRQEEVGLWKGYLVDELKARNCGWVSDGTLKAPPGHLYSPYKEKRWHGNSQTSS